MKVFVAGATGAIGKPLIALLLSKGHEVVASARSTAKAEALSGLGAEPVTMDGLNRESVMAAVTSTRPDVIVHEMTGLGSARSLRNFDKVFAVTNRLRTEGTEHLIAASKEAGTRKIVVQSYTGWPNERTGGPVKSEDDPLDSNPARTMTESLKAIRKLEELAISAPGITGTVLRYGNYYGPGTAIAADGEIVRMVRKRQFPVVGAGTGIWSFIHVDDAAEATRLAVEREAPGIYNIVDDEPAEVRVWLPELAKSVGAKPPFRVPAWLGRLLVGESVALMMTKVRGASNAKAKRVLGWQLKYPSWRQGFNQLTQGATNASISAAAGG